MKRLILALCCLLLPAAALAQNCITSGNVTSWTYFVAVDSNDKVTRETGLSGFTVYRSRNGGAAAAFTTPTINETDSSNMPGVYELLLDEDMTIGSGNDVEHMVLHIAAAGMEPVTKEICIARAKITAGETLTVASGVGSANAVQISGHSGAADALEALHDGTAGAKPGTGIIDSGTLQSVGADTATLRSAAAFPDNTLQGATLLLTSGTYAGLRVVIEDNDDDVVTFGAWPGGVTPSGTPTYELWGTAPFSGESAGGGASLEDIEALLPTNFGSLAISSGGVVQADVRQYGGSAGTFTSGQPTVRLSTGTGTGQISLSSGLLAWNPAWDAEVQSEATDALNAYDPPTNSELEARTLAAASYATASALATVDNNVDAVKAVTDLLPDAGALSSLATAAAQATSQGVLDKLDDTLEDNSGTYRFTEAALANAPAGEGGGGGGTDWDADERAAIRAILGIPVSGTTPADPSSGILDTIRDSVATRASQTSVDDLPTNSELATALAGADDATLSAIAALNNLSSAQAQSAASAALAAYDPPTRAEATSDANSILAAIGDLNDITVGEIRAMVVEDQGNITLGCALAAILAYTGGDITTTGANSTYEDHTGTETRMTITVTSPGNRVSTLTCPSY